MASQNHVDNLVYVVNFGAVHTATQNHVLRQVGGSTGVHLVQGDNKGIVLGVVGSSSGALGVDQLQGDGRSLVTGLGEVLVGVQGGTGNGDLLGVDALSSQSLQLVVAHQFGSQLHAQVRAQASHLICGSVVLQVHCSVAVSIPSDAYGNIPNNASRSFCSRRAERNHCDDQHECQKHRK
ncbi:MAG: hypothetical protein ACLU5C_04680 [Acutalibacter sp.]